MKSTKQIREQFDLITEKEEKEDRKLSALVRAGLYDAKKLPALKKALEKSADKMTSQEKRMLLNLLDSLISQVVSDDQVYRKVRQNVHSMNEAKEDYLSKFDPRFKAGYPSDRDIPSVLILKRKAIRVYPDNQKVALYYSQALDKYVTIPFSDIQLGVNEEIELTEETSEERKKRIAAETPEEKKKRITGALTGAGTRKMLSKGKVLRSQKSLISKVKASAKNIADISQRSGKAIAAGVATGNLFRAGIKSAYNAFRVASTENKLQDRLAKRKENKLVARRKEVSALTKQKRQEAKAKETKASTPTTIPTLKTRSPEKTAKRMAANPDIDYMTAAKNHAAKANVTENFNRRLDILRTEKQVGTNYLNEEEDGYTYDPKKENQKKFSKLSGASSGKTVKDYISRRKKWKSGPKGNWQIKPEPGNFTVNKLKDKAETFARRATGNIGDLVGLTDPKRGEGLAIFNPGAAQAGDLAGAALTIGTGPSRATLKAAEVVASASKLADKAVDATSAVNKADKAVDATSAASAANKADKAADATSAANKLKKGKGKFSKLRNLPRRILNNIRRARFGALAAGVLGTAGTASASGGNGVLSPRANPQFGKLKLNTGSAFAQDQDDNTATEVRRNQARVKALTTEEEKSSYVLSQRADHPQVGRLKLSTSSGSSSARKQGKGRNPTATEIRIQRQQLAALTNESVIDTIKNMVANNIQETKLSFNEQEITINNTVAKKLLNVYESVNKTNKKKMEQMLNESATSFNKVLTFAVRQ